MKGRYDFGDIGIEGRAKLEETQKTQFWGVQTTCTWSVCDVIVGNCEECNEFPNLFKGGGFLDYLWDYYLAKNDYISQGHLVISLSWTAQPKALQVVNSITFLIQAYIRYFALSLRCTGKATSHISRLNVSCQITEGFAVL